MAELGDLFVSVARPTLRAHQFDVPFPFGLVVPEFLYLFFKLFDSLVESPHLLLGMAGLRRRAWFFARNEKYSSGLIKDVIEQVSGKRYLIGPYQKAGKKAVAAAPTAQQTLDALAQLGVQVEYEDEQKGKKTL